MTTSLTPRLRLVEETGLLTREGFQALQEIQDTITGDTLTALSELTSTAGLVVQIGASAFTKRSIAVGSGLSVANPAGTAGDPTVSLDADLVSIAALSTDAYGRNLLTLASEAAFKAAVNLEAGTDFYSVAGANAAFQPLDADLTTLAATFAVGTWSPTLAGTANLDSVTLTGVGLYFRAGARVFGAFEASVDPTAGADAATTFTFTLPVASNFATVQDCLGAATFGVAQRAGAISASVAGDVGVVTFAAEGVAAIAITCIFGYIVI